MTDKDKKIMTQQIAITRTNNYDHVIVRVKTPEEGQEMLKNLITSLPEEAKEFIRNLDFDEMEKFERKERLLN